MTWLAAAASVVVGGAFVVAGSAKLAAGPAWPVSARQLGAPGWVVPILPWVELIVGALLVVQILVPWPAIVASALLVSFSGLIVARLRAGERPVCACFGRWSAQPIGRGHLVRNAGLLVLSVLAMFA